MWIAVTRKVTARRFLAAYTPLYKFDMLPINVMCRLGILFYLYPVLQVFAQKPPAQIYREVRAAVVLIQGERKFGSGVIVSHDGRVLTNCHVIAGERYVSVKLASGIALTADEIAGSDCTLDVAVLKLSGREFPTVELGNSEALSPGDAVTVISNPLGLENSITNGLVSGIRDFEHGKSLQISAPVSPGSSGGPVFDRDGKLVGIVRSTLLDGQNINLAVPINAVRDLLKARTLSKLSDLKESHIGRVASSPPRNSSDTETPEAQTLHDLATALATLKAAEGMKDPDLVKKWSNITGQIAQKVITAQPKDKDEVEEWKKRVEFAKQVNNYSEYSLYAMALQTTDPRQKIDLIEDLQKRNPQSQYLGQVLSMEFQAYRQTGDNYKAVALAEKILTTDQTNEDMLLIVADSCLQQGREPEKVVAYSTKLIDVMNTRAKPEGVSDADWENRKKTITGLGHFMIGKQYFNQHMYGPADNELRKTLPLAEGNQDLKAEVLFLLGFANYKIEHIKDALRFNQQCAAIASRFQAQAAKNVTVIKSHVRQ